jgi:hypothetical protein
MCWAVLMVEGEMTRWTSRKAGLEGGVPFLFLIAMLRLLGRRVSYAMSSGPTGTCQRRGLSCRARQGNTSMIGRA